MGEDNATETPKRKAGRPAKPESEKKQKVVVAKASEAKRGRGRPKGSKNKPKKLVVTKGKRGRQAKKESASEESAEDAE
ncbi:high mobility group protein HMG-I/HMG-Y-like [Macrobrachium nipponense]|uniref:high mobility group protein HMG-I/HMG-Y-like n=1 Tax=Macrobrachium nipponense TaxID=159736 RepID=UPI0030C82495